MRFLVRLCSIVLITCTLAGCAFVISSGGGTQPPAANPDSRLAEHAPGRVLVRPAAGADPAAIAAAVGGRVEGVRNGLARIVLPSGAGVTECLKTLSALSEVVYAEPVYIYRTPLAETTVVTRADLEGQWGYEGFQGIDAAGVWSLATPPDTSGVIVAVVDTGIDIDHPELTGRITGGFNTITGDADYDDDNGHGTHVAGIIGAAADDQGVTGVAHGVEFLAVKVLSAEGSGTNDQIYDGIIWAADNGADVINMSLGGWGRSQAIQDAVDYANSLGVIVVAAMGNGYKAGWTHYPAACEGVIAVGATIPGGTRADFSSTGPHISVAAPGIDILSSVPPDPGLMDPVPHYYEYYSGTSMAAPFVTGTVALLLAKEPTLAGTMVRTLLEETASLGPDGWNSELGCGQINALYAYEAVGTISDSYGGLTVTVTSGGLPITNAEVLIVEASENEVRTANRTNADGEAVFTYLPAGSYTVKATKVTDGAVLSGQTTTPVTVTGGTTGPVAVTIQ